MRRLRAIDLFCGTGGFSRGAHMNDFEVVGAYDWDPKLTYSFNQNFPNTELHLKDISELSGQEVLADSGDLPIDLVFGGPPCQGFSAIGRRASDDPRRTLLGDYFRLVSEIEPAAFVMENVEGLLYKDAIQELHRSLEKLEGYRLLPPRVLNAADYGAATNRRRTFVIGYNPDLCDLLRWDDFEAVKVPSTNVQQALSGLTEPRFLRDSDDGFDLWKLTRGSRLGQYAASLASSDRTFTGNQRTKHTKAVTERFASVDPGGMDKIGRYPRLRWDGQCPTLRAGTGSDKGSYQAVRPIHPEEDRVITVREAARLQGFPDCHRFHPTTWHSFRQIGNSVSPIIAAEILGVIARALESGQPLSEAAE